MASAQLVAVMKTLLLACVAFALLVPAIAKADASDLSISACSVTFNAHSTRFGIRVTNTSNHMITAFRVVFQTTDAFDVALGDPFTLDVDHGTGLDAGDSASLHNTYKLQSGPLAAKATCQIVKIRYANGEVWSE